MSIMGKYCKAYQLKALRAFDGWSEKVENAKRETKVVNGEEVETIREIGNDAIVYVQENYIVTDGIFKDENVLFDVVTPEWIEYCQNVLEFEIPDFALTETVRSGNQGV